MDTISRENNSYLPIAGVILGVLALVLSAAALLKLSSTNKTVAAQGEQLVKLDTLESEVRTATAASEKAASSIASLTRSTQEAFNGVGTELGSIRGEITKLQEAAAKPAPAPKGDKKGPAAPAVAGPDEYVVKGGDTGMKIAKAKGVSLADLKAVNPGVNWNGLKAGEKIKLPKK